MKYHPSMTRTEIAILILKNWRRWPSLARVLLRYGPAEIRVRLLCWWNGYTVRGRVSPVRASSRPAGPLATAPVRPGVPA